jgi:Zn-dependent metalloprotease
MHYSKVLTTTVTSLIICSASIAMADADSAMSQIRNDHPNLMTVNRAGQIHKILDKELSVGKTPIASAENFIKTFSPALDVDAKEFIERGPFPDRHFEQELMYIPETGGHKFTGVYYMQTADGLPVYGSRLMVLVRNINDFPAVSATTDLRDVKGYKVPKRLVASEAVALMAAATHLGRGATVTPPELMVFAGTDKEHSEPTAALVFEATVGGNWDIDNYKKFELVVDAQTGEILHEENRILHVDGNVSGMATESSGADVCDPESAAGLPYAKVTLGGSTEYADANGNFTIAGSGTITSTLDGRWFDSQNQSGSDASLSQNSSDPNFLHSEANNNEQYRAQVNAYLQSNVVRDFTLSYAPAFPVIATQTSFPVKTGVSGTCNAFYDYSSINFYNAGGGCSNTAFSVIVHHEYGHHLVSSAGSGQGAYGEGMGDVMGVLITGDNQLARGFYSNDCVNGIRNAINNHQYPCSGEIHDCGQLISGCVWDALAEMEASYPITGRDIVATLAINSMMMHSGTGITPSIATDWLVLDDDDGDLGTGTPHCDEIMAGFGMHNMAVSNYDCPNPSLAISFPDGKPNLVNPNGGTLIAVDISNGTSEPVDGSEQLLFNEGSGWVTLSLVPEGGSSYSAIFPSFDCGASVDWYVSAEPVVGATVTSPSDAPVSSWYASAYSGTDIIFDDNFQSNQGWTVSAGAGTGNWIRVVPSEGGDRCDSGTDADGSGMCYVTGNGGDEDVDNGTTILYSPIMDASNAPVLSYYRWYSNGVNCDGADPNNDIFEVDVSSDGGSTWMNLETVGPYGEGTDGGWFFKEFDLSNVSGFEPTANFQVRFVCGDLNSGSVIEAGVDGVLLSQGYCDDASCTGDVNSDGVVDVSDILAVVGSWGNTGGPEDINGDGIVDVSDVLALVGAWGPCP